MTRNHSSSLNYALRSKLPDVGTTIFTVMSQLAAECGAVNLTQGSPDFPPPTRLRIDPVEQARRIREAEQ